MAGARRYELADRKHAKVNIDYCVCYDDRLYSVPYTLVGARVEIRATASVVELFHDGVRVASHARSYGRKGSAVIVDEHRPRAHRDYGKWPPERVVAWAETIGPNVGELARAVMRHRTHPEAGYRTCQGVAGSSTSTVASASTLRSPVRLTFAEALAAAGRQDEAAAAIASARAALLARAEKLSDPAWRERFLRDVPDNARTLERAARWLGG